MNSRRLFVTISLCAGCAAQSQLASGPSPASPPASAPSAPTSTAAAPAAPAPSNAAAPPAPPPPPVQVLPFDEALTKATEALFSKAQISARPPPFELVIDPLIDGVTGEQSNATSTMGDRIASLVRTKYSNYTLVPFSRQSVARSPIVLIGTFTAVNRDGKTVGPREAYRICLVLIDLRSGRVVGKAWSRAQMTGIDTSPKAFFRDSPTWSQDPTVDGYVKTCQATKVGDPIDQVYLDHILVSALVGEAVDAYNARNYKKALQIYTEAQRIPGGADELRVLNGLYLTNYKLGRKDAASLQFGRIVDHGLASKQLSVKFLFKVGSTAFLRDPAVSGPYASWLRRIAERSAASKNCLEISGHTSPTGPEPLNLRLSQLRAEAIQEKLTSIERSLDKHTIAVGMGSRENLVGTGRDDDSDALDRRVAFKVIDCRT